MHQLSKLVQQNPWIVTALGVVVASAWALINMWLPKGRASKRLTYRFLADTRYRKSLHRRLVVELYNSGAQALTEGDFYREVAIVLPPDSELEVARVIESSDGIEPEVSIDGDRVIVRKTLINPGERIVVSVEARSSVGDVAITGRIVNGKIIRYKRGDLSQPRWYVFTTIVLTGYISVELFMPTVTKTLWQVLWPPMLGYMVATIAWAVYYSLAEIRDKRLAEKDTGV